MSVLFILRSRVSLALLALGVALIVAAACGDGGDDAEMFIGDETPAVGETPTDGETPAGGDSAEIQMLPGNTFSTGELTIVADAEVTITADNTDGTHNFAVFSSEDVAGSGEGPIAETGICGAPCEDSVNVNLAAGEYFFRCQVHPAIMTGTLVVQ